MQQTLLRGDVSTGGQSRGYEFDESENQHFRRLEGAMTFVAWAQIVIAVLVCGVAFVDLVAGQVIAAGVALVEALLFMLIGLWTRNAARSVRMVVQTQGADNEHLMEAVSALGKLYGLQRAIYIAAIVLIGAAMFFAIALATMVRSL